MVEIDKKVLGQRIKSIRLDKGMTLEEFGKLFGASKSSVLGWESGRNAPNKERLKTIAKLGNVSTERLLYGDFLEATDTLSQQKAKILLENTKLKRWAEELASPAHEEELLKLNISELINDIEELQENYFYEIIRVCSSYSLKKQKGELSLTDSIAIYSIRDFLSEHGLLSKGLLIQLDNLLEPNENN